jgi:hypothetical protein
MERSYGLRLPHHDRGFGDIVREERDGSVTRTIVPMRAAGDRRYRAAEPLLVPTIEAHCMLFTRAALRSLAPFDESFTAGTHVDLCLTAREKGIALGFAPGARVTHLPMSWASPLDRALYRFRWDPTLAALSRDAIAVKWSIANMPDVGDFAWQQQFRTDPVSWAFMRAAAISRRLFARS